jgi:hypothetical protein
MICMAASAHYTNRKLQGERRIRQENKYMHLIAKTNLVKQLNLDFAVNLGEGLNSQAPWLMSRVRSYYHHSLIFLYIFTKT